MKGQVSLEYLLISAVALVMLSLSAAALLNIKEYSEESRELFKFRSSAIALANAADEVCSLGNGNQRTVVLHSRMAVDWDGAIIISNKTSVIRDIPCEVMPEDGLEGVVTVKNNNGIVKIREQ